MSELRDMMSSDYEVDVSSNSPLEIEDDEEYKQQLALFTNCSTEKGIELIKFRLHELCL